MRKAIERIFQLLGLLGLPGDLRLLWNVLLPAAPGVLAGFSAYAQEASWPVLALLVVAAYVLFFLASIPVTNAISRRKTKPEAKELTDAASNAPQQQLPTYGGSMSYPVLQGHEIENRHIQNRTVYIADLARALDELDLRSPLIRERTFERCRIHGPAVLFLKTGKRGHQIFDDDCRWDEDAAAFWIAGPPTHPHYTASLL